MELTYFVITGALALAAGLASGYIIRQLVAKKNANSIEAKIKQQLEEAKNQSREVLLGAKDKAVKILEDAKNQERERLAILSSQEERLNLQLKKVDQKESGLESVRENLERQANEIKNIRQEVDNLKIKSASESSTPVFSSCRTPSERDTVDTGY